MNTSAVISRCFVLTCVGKRSIINAVGCLPAKGGCCDNDGEVLNSRGGGNRTGSHTLHRQRDATQRRNAGTQVRYKVAYQPDRVRGVEKTETESVQTVS